MDARHFKIASTLRVEGNARPTMPQGQVWRRVKAVLWGDA
ncbi:hypothetical protein BH10PSE12_BH10PSE12_03020 [soil metagenome]